MNLIRVRNNGQGIRYITEDCKYKIWKLDNKSSWQLLENVGNRYKLIQSFKYFKDAKKLLKEIIG